MQGSTVLFNKSKLIRIFWVLFFCGVLNTANSQNLPNIAPEIVAENTKADPGYHSLRVYHIELLDLSPAEARDYVDRAEGMNFNAIILLISNNVQFDSTPWIKNGWTKANFIDWSNYVASKHMSLIIELKLLTQQNFLLAKYFPDLMFNSGTYNPDNTKVYKIIFPLIDEIISSVHPRAIHIGHDEVLGFARSKYLPKILYREKMLPASLFLKDVKILRNFIKSKNVETWMWGDMLISPNEFPEIKATDINGGSVGYGEILRKQIPKDIVICDWHYYPSKSFPTLKKFKSEGFTVLGATWKDLNAIKSFSKYAKENGADGMISTTWFEIRKSPEIASEILSVSGRSFYYGD